MLEAGPLPTVVQCRVTDPPLELEVSDTAFRPNPTTVRFGRALRVPPGAVVFDIGTGVGPLAIKAAMLGAARVLAVDPVGEHCDLARRNVARHGLRDLVTILQGLLFEPLEADPSLRGLRADAIIGDVSGIADPIAHALGWYPDQVPAGGEDGTGPIRDLLAQAGRWLAPGGTLYFPIATDLSDGDRILAAAGHYFESVVNSFDRPYIEFPLTDAEVGAIDRAYASRGGLPPFVRIQQGRRPFWRGQILAASGPRPGRC